MGLKVVKGYTKEIRDALKPEGGEKFATEIEGFLRGIERDVSGLSSDLKLANKEAETRKEKLRESEGIVDERDETIKDLQEKIDTENPDLKLLEDLQAFKKRTVKAQRASFVDSFAGIAEHANFEKAKPFLVLPDPDDEGVYDFTTVSDNDMEKNVLELQKMVALGTFEQVGENGKVKVHGVNQHKGKTTTQSSVDEINADLASGKISSTQAEAKITALAGSLSNS